MISISVSVIVYFPNFIKEKNSSEKFFGVFIFLVLHGMMTVFFTRGFTLENFMYFSAIWILPLFIGIIVWFGIQIANQPFKTISGSLFSLPLIGILSLLFHTDSENGAAMLIFTLLFFWFGVIFSFIPYNRYWNFIFFLSYTFIFVSILVMIAKIEHSIQLSFFIKLTIYILIPLILSVILSSIYKNKLVEKSTPSQPSENENTKGGPISYLVQAYTNLKTHPKRRVIIIIILLFAYVIIPRVSTETAKIIRSFTPASELQFDKITYKGLDGKPRTIKGVIVTEQDNVLYIANTSWKLEPVKTSAYEVEPAQESNPDK